MSDECRIGPLVGLLAAHTVSLTGNVLTLVALPLYVLAQTGSAATTGLVGAVATVPIVLGGAFGGVLVDRFGYRRASVAADLAGTVTIGAVPLLDATVGLPLWALLLLVFATGLLDTPGEVARRSLLPEAAAAARVPLERAVAWFSATDRGSRLLGAPLAGLLVAGLGALNVLALDAATFAVAAVTVLLFVPATLASRGADERTADGDAARPATGRAYWRELGEGLRFLRRDPLLWAITVLLVVTNAFDAAKSTVLWPVAAQQFLGGGPALGLLFGVMGGAALVGTLVFGAVGLRLPRRAVFVTAFVLAGPPPYVAMAAGVPLPGLLAVTVVAGLASGALNPIIGAVQLERVPPGLRARVYGVAGAAAWAAMPAGSLAGGQAVEHVGLIPTLYGIGIAYLLVALLPLLGGPWRGLDRTAQAADAERPTDRTPGSAG